MDLNWLESILFGFVSGLADILPVSAQAHRTFLLKLFGAKGSSDLMYLLIHLGIFAGLFFHNHANIRRMSKARALAKVPKKRRKRPLDTRSLMDSSLMRTILIPALLGLLFYRKASGLGVNMIRLSFFVLLNAAILYIPQYLPTSNRDSRTLSRVEGILIGFAGAFAVIPGISAVGAMLAVSSVCGMDAAFSLSMVLIADMFLNAGYMFFDIQGILTNGFGLVSFAMFVRYILIGVTAFAGTVLGIRVMRRVCDSAGIGVFSMYCIGLALLSFILNLLA